MSKIRKLINQGNFIDGQEFHYRRKHKSGILSNDWRISRENHKVNKSSHFFNSDYVFYMNENDEDMNSSEFGIQKNPSAFDGDFNQFYWRRIRF